MRTFKNGWSTLGILHIVLLIQEVYIVDRKKELIKVRGFQVALLSWSSITGHPKS